MAPLVGGREALGRLTPAVTDVERIGARGGSAGPGRLLLASVRPPAAIGIACDHATTPYVGICSNVLRQATWT